MNKLSIVLGIGVALGAAACSGADDDGPRRAAGATPGAATKDTASSAVEACVAKGARGNDRGVGAYCDKQATCPDDRFCTGDFGAPEGASFCTRICQTDDDCGAGAYCLHESRGSGCVLVACKEKP